jgi:hypothetical protein
VEGTVPRSSNAAVPGAASARFITINAHPLSGSQSIRRERRWDLEGQLPGFQFMHADNGIESIYGLCEAAGRIEREVRDQFAAEFRGRECEPLHLCSGNKVGVYLRA